jgi:electron transfer flavoprotein beta subunit
MRPRCSTRTTLGSGASHVANVLVCIKRVPDVAGEVLLTDDALAVDARHVGFTVSPHEECAVELATQVAESSGGTATVLTVGPADSVEQLRTALAVGCSSGVLVEADTERYGPADVAAAIASVIRAREAAGTPVDLVLLGNDAADTGDFQVPVRLAYALDRPVLTGISSCAVSGDRVIARGDGADGVEIFEVPLPAVVAVMEGGVNPRYPSITGRMKAKKAPVETVAPDLAPSGNGRVRLKLPPPRKGTVEVLGHGSGAASAVVDLLFEIGVVSP